MIEKRRRPTERHVADRIDVSRTGSAEASDSSYVNTGVHIGDICLHTGLPVHTRYREQVRRIAPPNLSDRERELAELTAFCTATSGPRYAWWRAKAWTGKSALMSWFVLNPPPGVRIVSFFVTARLAGQSDRRAFIDNVFEQLATILDEQLPPYMTEYTREAHLLGMLRDAAALCRERTEHFVLLVDGLDEDRGVTTGPDAHSIAALLPPDPPVGMKVIVAGRPNPPIPSDVSPGHPLFDKSIVRNLADSTEARVVRGDMERELKQLLTGDQAQRDLLGLLTTAVGGLSSADLAELTHEERWVIDDHLSTVAGRTFRTRTGRWRGNTETYILGHEELQASARTFLGRAAQNHYVERLHRWADGYRASGWPVNTPEYLLSGYFRLLAASVDFERLVSFVADPARHDRMLALSGSDSAALAEIREVQDLILSCDGSDVVAMARLAVHREHLVDRNTRIPVHAPAVWEYLGAPDRAEALAGSMPVDLRPDAYAQIANAAADRGDFDRALTLLRSLPDDGLLADEMVTLSLTLAEGGLVREAENIMPPSSNLDVKAARTALLLGAAGDFRRAETALNSIVDEEVMISCACDLAAAAFRAGHRWVGVNLTARAEEAMAEFDPWPVGLAQLTNAVATSGNLQRAMELAAELDELENELLASQKEQFDVYPFRLATPLSPPEKVQLFTTLLTTAIATGQDDYADQIDSRLKALIEQMSPHPPDAQMAFTVPTPLLGISGRRNTTTTLSKFVGLTADQSPYTLSAMALMCAKGGRFYDATQLVLSSEAGARNQRDHNWRDRDVEPLLKALAASGNIERAEELAKSLPEPRRSIGLDNLTQAAVRSGFIEDGYRVASNLPNVNSPARAMVFRALLRTNNYQNSWSLVNSMTDPEGLLSLVPAAPVDLRAKLLERAQNSSRGVLPEQGLAGALTAAERRDTAFAVARGVRDPVEREWTWGEIAIQLYRAGDREEALRVLESISEPFRHGWLKGRLSLIAAARGDIDEAGTLAESISEPHSRARAMVDMVGADRPRTLYWADKAELALDDVGPPAFVDRQRRALAGALARVGQFDRARTTVRTIANPTARAGALARIAAHSGLDIADHVVMLLRTCPWTALLATLSRKHPDALLAIADELSPVPAHGATAD